MIVAELSGLGRICIMGSCRVINPIREVIWAKGGKVVLPKPDAYTHTAREALQQMRIAGGELDVPEALRLLVLGEPGPPQLTANGSELIRTADAYVLEISTVEDLHAAGWRLSRNYVVDHFTRGGGPGMLEWYRVLSAAPMDEAVAERAAASLAAAGREVTDWHRRVLSEAAAPKLSEAEVGETINELTAEFPGRWLIVPVFGVPGAKEAHVRDRLAIRDLLCGVAADLGHGFFDPYATIAAAGRETALKGGGVDVFHYATEFLPVIGQPLLDAAFAPRAGR